MRQFKVSEVPLRGRGFTLYPVCNEENVDEELASSILYAMNISVGCIGKEGYSNNEQMKVEESDPLLPNEIKREHFINENAIESCVKAGLIAEKEGQYELTEKMILLLEGMVKKKAELDSSNFHYCPCEMF